MTYALNSANGAPATGWPQFSADSVFSTAAVGDLYGTGSDDFVVGGASSHGFALGTHYSNGGHVRIYNDHGGADLQRQHERGGRLLPRRRPDPARRRLRDRDGHGQLLPRRQRREHGQGLRHQVQPGVERHARRHDGRQPRAGRRAGQRPARRGRGHRRRDTTGSVWALNAATGAAIWQTNVGRCRLRVGDHGRPHRQRRPGRHRADDHGLYILDGPTGQLVANVDDGSGNGGVPPARSTASRTPRSSPPMPTGRSASRSPGTSPSGGNDVQGIVQHFEVTGSDAAQCRRSRRLAAVPPRRGTDRVRRGRQRPRDRATAPPRRRTAT